MSIALDVQDVQCVRGSRVVFSGVSAAVRDGELLLVLGANGAGKTSLLRMICGLSSPDQGVVSWRGRPVARQRETFNRQLVYLGHAPALKDDLTALENLQASRQLSGATCSEREAADALSVAGLRPHARLPARALSQGQRKRIGIARLVLGTASSPWVLDEPFDGLDEAACAWLQGLITAQVDRGGVVVLTSHLSRSWAPGRPPVVLELRPPRQAPRAAVDRTLAFAP